MVWMESSLTKEVLSSSCVVKLMIFFSFFFVYVKLFENKGTMDKVFLLTLFWSLFSMKTDELQAEKLTYLSRTEARQAIYGRTLATVMIDLTPLRVMITTNTIAPHWHCGWNQQSTPERVISAVEKR